MISTILLYTITAKPDIHANTDEININIYSIMVHLLLGLIERISMIIGLILNR